MTPRTAVPTLALLPVLLAVALTGCSSGSDGSGADASSAGGAADTSSVVAGAAEAPALQDGAVAGRTSASSIAQGKPGPDVIEPAVIRKGNVALRADDVGEVQQEVQGVVDQLAGEVTDEKTTTDEDGQPAYTRMVLRIPSEQFDEAMTALKEIDGADLENAATSQEDVTTELIDTQTRLAAQKRSIARITVLFDRAQSIRDIMAIESELSQRQADLESLERRLAYLRGQTSLSTIVVSVDQTAATAPPEDDDSGFLAGLASGWHALVAFAVALATAFGAVLPWLLVAAVLAWPTWALVRWLRRRLSARSPARTPSAG